MTSRMHAAGRSAAPQRSKRNSLHLDASAKKRQKIDANGGARSPSVHTVATSMKQLLPPPVSFETPGLALVFGVGDTGQLGLGPDITERSRPSRFSKSALAALGTDEKGSELLTTQICAGGMHTVCLTHAGRVITCGCNDECALGRIILSSDIEPESPVKKTHFDEESSETDSTQLPAAAEESYPAYVPIPPRVKISMVSAGDSHTAALDAEGHVWLWGTFRGSNGPIGLTEDGEISPTPKRLFPHTSHSSTMDKSYGSEVKSSQSSLHMVTGAHVIKIASGQDHIVFLTDEGRLYTMGCGEQGQLGRIAERFARTGGRNGMSALLSPAECRVRGAVRFSDAWAGGFATFARCQTTGTIYACGLNNYGQLGLKKPIAVANGDVDEKDETLVDGSPAEDGDDPEVSTDAVKLINDRNEADKSEAALIARQGPLIQFMLTKAQGFDPSLNWRQFAISMHHTVALDAQGHVYTVGRSDYGRLGLGKAANPQVSVVHPSRVHGLLTDRVCTWVGCGESCSFAVDSAGIGYSWGMGSNKQLGHGDDDDDCFEPGIIKGKQLENRRVSMIDAGGQHTVLLVHLKDTAPVVPMEVEAVASGNEINENGPPPPKDKLNHAAIKDPLVPNVTSDVAVFSAATAYTTTHTKLTHLSEVADQVLTAPAAATIHSRRNRHVSPSSVTGYVPAAHGPGADSTTCSTAGATINSSVHSSAVSDTSSVGSCASNTSTSSQLNSAKSTDGGGSSRCSSFDTCSVQSSLPVCQASEDASVAAPNSGTLMLDPLSASLLAGSRSLAPANRVGGYRSAQIRSAGISICSTSSEAGLLTDTISLGSMTASPADVVSGEQSNS